MLNLCMRCLAVFDFEGGLHTKRAARVEARQGQCFRYRRVKGARTLARRDQGFSRPSLALHARAREQPLGKEKLVGASACKSGPKARVARRGPDALGPRGEPSVTRGNAPGGGSRCVHAQARSQLGTGARGGEGRAARNEQSAMRPRVAQINQRTGRQRVGNRQGKAANPPFAGGGSWQI